MEPVTITLLPDEALFLERLIEHHGQTITQSNPAEQDYHFIPCYFKPIPSLPGTNPAKTYELIPSGWQGYEAVTDLTAYLRDQKSYGTFSVPDDGSYKLPTNFSTPADDPIPEPQQPVALDIGVLPDVLRDKLHDLLNVLDPMSHQQRDNLMSIMRRLLKEEADKYVKEQNDIAEETIENAQIISKLKF